MLIYDMAALRQTVPFDGRGTNSEYNQLFHPKCVSEQALNKGNNGCPLLYKRKKMKSETCV